MLLSIFPIFFSVFVYPEVFPNLYMAFFLNTREGILNSFCPHNESQWSPKQQWTQQTCIVGTKKHCGIFGGPHSSLLCELSLSILRQIGLEA